MASVNLNLKKYFEQRRNDSAPITIYIDDKPVEITQAEWKKMVGMDVAKYPSRDATVEISGVFDQASGLIWRTWSSGVPNELRGMTVAERAWEQHGGVVACECDDLDCEWILELTKTEYCAASGVGGMYRLTHPNVTPASLAIA